MLPTPKRKVQTKTTSNTVGSNPSDAATPVVASTTASPAAATPTDAASASPAAALKTSKQSPGELPTSTDEYVTLLLASHNRGCLP